MTRASDLRSSEQKDDAKEVTSNSATATTSEAPPQSRIPHTLFFTYKHNILETREPSNFYDNIMYTVSQYRTLWGEPDAPIRFMDDAACAEEIEAAEPRLVQYFENGGIPAWKADVCRIAALYNAGGYYFDIDLKVVQPVALDHKKANISFVTVHETASYMGFFQAFIASTQRNPILKKALDFMLEYYEKRRSISGNIWTQYSQRCV